MGRWSRVVASSTRKGEGVGDMVMKTKGGYRMRPFPPGPSLSLSLLQRASTWWKAPKGPQSSHSVPRRKAVPASRKRTAAWPPQPPWSLQGPPLPLASPSGAEGRVQGRPARCEVKDSAAHTSTQDTRTQA